MLHQEVLDILRGVVHRPEVHVLEDLDRMKMARTIRAAEVFDFGELPLEQIGPGSSIFEVPHLTDDEKSFFREGLVPLPADLCWFEFTLGHKAIGLLILGEQGRIKRITQVALDDFNGAGQIDDIRLAPRDDDTFQVFSDSVQLSEQLRTAPNQEELIRYFAGVIATTRYLTLMLNSKTTDKERRPAGPRRTAGNRHGLPAHTLVTIVPARYVRHETGAGGERRPPRLHWRRSHLREYKSPSGEVYHRVVIPRALVGKAEDGAVTHVYRVKPDEAES